jgi:hypothetical protein
MRVGRGIATLENGILSWSRESVPRIGARHSCFALPFVNRKYFRFVEFVMSACALRTNLINH